ncbi:7814_t:CDS:2, partial [Paraglomus brasilianum]
HQQKLFCTFELHVVDVLGGSSERRQEALDFPNLKSILHLNKSTFEVTVRLRAARHTQPATSWMTTRHCWLPTGPTLPQTLCMPSNPPIILAQRSLAGHLLDDDSPLLASDRPNPAADASFISTELLIKHTMRRA